MSRANDQWSHSPSKLEGKLPQRLLTRLSQVWGHREGGEKDVEDELRLASAATPSSTLKAYSVPPREERTLQPLMNFIPLLTFPFPPWSVTLLSPSPRKSERGLLVFGACCYTDQGLGTMWFLRCRPGGERRQAWAGPCGTVVKSSALQTHGEVSPIYVKICVV